MAPLIRGRSISTQTHIKTNSVNKVRYQVNLQRHFGGGEVYTRFFSEALLSLGWKVILFVHPRANFWDRLLPAGIKLIQIDSDKDLASYLPSDKGIVISHAPLSAETAIAIRQNHILVTFAHMPLYGRKSVPFQSADLIFGVSKHVLESLKAAGIQHYYPEPLYGVADLERGEQPDDEICNNSVYEWDIRKFRDRLLSFVYPIYQAIIPKKVFKRKPGLTLGIVSRLTPIKQFPEMFRILAPILKQFPNVNLEIFGSGGYASVRDLKRSLRPIRYRVRFWGQQRNMQKVYQQIDYLLTGLPEREALGLNIIEAQICGTPVIAVDAPPFTETILEGKSGYLYCDPRSDNGDDFKCLLKKFTSGTPHPKPTLATEHLTRFGRTAFTERVAAALEYTMKIQLPRHA